MANETGQASRQVGNGGALPCRLSCGELQEVLAWQEIVLPVEPISCSGQFFDDGLTRDEVMFGESKLAGSFVVVEVDDGDARPWL